MDLISASEPVQPTPPALGLRRKKLFDDDTGYKGQRRIFLRWRHELTTMLLHARARGDRAARIELTGFLGPGINQGDGSFWMLVLNARERREESALSSGRVPRKTKRRTRPDGVYFGSRQGHSVCLLKARPQTRFFVAR